MTTQSTHKHSRLLASLILGATLMTPALAVVAQDAPKPDNSANNKDQGRTADNQTMSKSDRETTASVRKALIADKNLSMYAHNVKIIVLNGSVTLKGPVKSESEKQQVVTDVASVVSHDNIVDHLTVKE